MKLSIVIPIYNTDVSVFKKCLNSIENQSLKINYEIIIVNDASTNIELVNYLKELENTGKYIIINNDKNYGLFINRTIGFAKATGDYTYFCDSDDTIDYNFMKIVYNKITENNPDMFKFEYIRTNESIHFKSTPIYENKYCGMFYSDKLIDIFYDRIKYKKQLYNEKVIYTDLFIWDCVFKTEVLRKSLTYFILNKDINIFIHEDNIFTFLILLNTKNILFSDDKLYNYTIGGYSNEISIRFTTNEKCKAQINSLYSIKYANQIKKILPEKEESINLFIEKMKIFIYEYTFKREDLINYYNEYLYKVENNQI